MRKPRRGSVIGIGLLSAAWPFWYIMATLLHRPYGSNIISILFASSGGVCFLLWMVIFTKYGMRRIGEMETNTPLNHLIKILMSSFVIIVMVVLSIYQYVLFTRLI